MQYLYHENCGKEILEIDGDLYKYLFKVRRANIDSLFNFRNLKDANIYEYKTINIDKRSATLKLESSKELIVEQDKKLHLLWSIVDPKTIEKQLPYLNEIGVDKVTFFYADFSQKNFKLNFEKLEKILLNSSQQCGRSSIIKLELEKSFDEVLKKYPESFMFNFSSNLIDDLKDNIQTIMIGCEGGFSNKEIEKIESTKVVGIKSNLILRSETAVTVVASKLLL